MLEVFEILPDRKAMAYNDLGISAALANSAVVGYTEQVMSTTFVLLAFHPFQPSTCALPSATSMEFPFLFWPSRSRNGVPNGELRRARLLKRILRVNDLDIKALMSSSNDCVKQPTANFHHEDLYPSFCGLLCLGTVCCNLRLWKSFIISAHSRRRKSNQQSEFYNFGRSFS